MFFFFANRLNKCNFLFISYIGCKFKIRPFSKKTNLSWRRIFIKKKKCRNIFCFTQTHESSVAQKWQSFPRKKRVKSIFEWGVFKRIMYLRCTCVPWNFYTMLHGSKMHKLLRVITKVIPFSCQIISKRWRYMPGKQWFIAFGAFFFLFSRLTRFNWLKTCNPQKCNQLNSKSEC